MTGFLRLVVVSLLALSMAHADPIETKPDFLDALPLTDTPDGVKIVHPFLLNPSTVVPAGATLRFFYVRPTPSEGDDVKKVSRPVDQQQQAYSRQSQSTEAPVYISAQMEAVLKASRTTVWPNIASFRASLDMINSTDLRIVYKTAGGKDLMDEPVEFAEGLFLGEKDGAVVVLAVVADTDASRGGFAAGDRVDSFDGTPLKGSLAAFQAAYTPLIDVGHIGKQKPYVFVVRHVGSEKAETISLRPPLSLDGSLLDQ